MISAFVEGFFEACAAPELLEGTSAEGASAEGASVTVESSTTGASVAVESSTTGASVEVESSTTGASASTATITVDAATGHVHTAEYDLKWTINFDKMGIVLPFGSKSVYTIKW